jgi:CxxC-x17-CxxC domain-containing protein
VYNDKNLTCADCSQEFVFTASEQDFYAQRGFTDPRRCPSCRASRKAARNTNGGAGAGSSYGSYGAGGGYSAGGSSYGGSSGGSSYGGSSGGYRDRGPREMFSATCSSCGKEAQVPFRPTSGKPVYCSDCFRTQRGSSY